MFNLVRLYCLSQKSARLCLISLSRSTTCMFPILLFCFKESLDVHTPRGGYASKQNGHTLQKYDITQRQFHADILSFTDPVPILTLN